MATTLWWPWTAKRFCSTANWYNLWQFWLPKHGDNAAFQWSSCPGGKSPFNNVWKGGSVLCLCQLWKDLLGRQPLWESAQEIFVCSFDEQQQQRLTLCEHTAIFVTVLMQKCFYWFGYLHAKSDQQFRPVCLIVWQNNVLSWMSSSHNCAFHHCKFPLSSLLAYVVVRNAINWVFLATFSG